MLVEDCKMKLDLVKDLDNIGEKLFIKLILVNLMKKVDNYFVILKKQL